MDTKRVIERIQEILAPILEELELELVEVTFRVEGGRWILRITIDHEDGVKVEHCTRVSRELDRPLKDEKDFEKYAGRLVYIKAHRSVAGRKKIRGTLEGIEDGIVKVLLEEGNRIEVPVEDISSARLDFKFE